MVGGMPLRLRFIHLATTDLRLFDKLTDSCTSKNAGCKSTNAISEASNLKVYSNLHPTEKQLLTQHTCDSLIT
jgi:hypothetical protein